MTNEKHGIASSHDPVRGSRRILRWTRTDPRDPNSYHRLSLRTLDAIYDLAFSDENQEEIPRRLRGRHNAPPGSPHPYIPGWRNLLDRPSNRTVIQSQ